MQKEDCFLVGTIFKLHGYKGKLKVYNENNNIFDFKEINYFLIDQNNTLIPFFIEEAKHTQKNIILAKFEDVNSEKEALKLLQNKVYLPNNLYSKINKQKFSEKEITDYKIIDINLGILGKVNFINTQTAQKLIYVKNDNKEFCFPMHDKFIVKINHKEKIINVDIPEEIINLN